MQDINAIASKQTPSAAKDPSAAGTLTTSDVPTPTLLPTDTLEVLKQRTRKQGSVEKITSSKRPLPNKARKRKTQRSASFATVMLLPSSNQPFETPAVVFRQVIRHRHRCSISMLDRS